MACIAIDHIAIVVSDMDAALGFWQQALGLELQRVESVPAEDVEVAFLETEERARRAAAAHERGQRHCALSGGEGRRAYIMSAWQSQTLRRPCSSWHKWASSSSTSEPRQREDGTRYAFVHPKSSGGVLVELYERG